MANQGTIQVEKRKIFRQWDVRHAGDAALCRLQEKVTATNSRLCIRRRHNHLSPSLYHFPCVLSFGFCFHIAFCEEDPFEGKRQQLCRRSVCQMQPDIQMLQHWIPFRDYFILFAPIGSQDIKLSFELASSTANMTS